MRLRVTFVLAGLLIACSGSDPMITGGDGGTVLPDGAVVDDDSGMMEDDSGIPLPKDPAPGENVSISEIAVFQTLKVPVAKSGAPASTTIPIISNKEALMRVYVHLEPGWTTHNIVGRLEITAGGTTKTFKDVLAPAVDSKDDTMLSTFNFKLTPDLVQADTTYKVEVLEQTKTAAPTTDPLPSRYPMDLTPIALKTTSVGAQLKLVLVPMKYNPDGSGRLPDTSQTQLDVYKNFFYSMYPAPAVQITVRAPVNINTTITPGGSGWSTALNTIINVRQSDGAAFDAYYYGIFMPTSSFQSFCGGGCIAGLSMLAQQPQDAYARSGIGLGYGGGLQGWASASTAAHEIGHQHGRNHAPCGGAGGVDPNYPYSQAATQNIGYALADIGIAPQGSILMPTGSNYTLRDIMGYCDPKWISDYTYKAFVTRMKAVNGAAIIPGKSVFYRWAMVDETGAITEVGPRFSNDMPPGGEPKAIGGKNGWFYPFDHLGGGMFLVPDEAQATKAPSARNLR